MASSNNNLLSFALLSVEGDSQDTGDKDLERAFQSLSLKQRLAAIQTAVGRDDAKLAFLPGAGAVYMSGCKYAVVENRWMAIFTGEIENYSYLVKKYCLAEAGLDPQGQYLLETVRALSPLNGAQLVALLFKKLGPTFMSKLRGAFTFAVYDSNVGRVLAANDCNGSGSLWQGHVDDCLVVACNMEVPTIQVAERTAIAAGEYKFGWRAAPVAYMASQQAVQSRCNEAMQAAMAALASASGQLPSGTSGPIPTPSTPVPALNRRYSKTMHRHSFQGSSRISLSAGASSVSSTAYTCASWNTPDSGAPRNSTSSQPGGGGGGSYVPPHRRSQQYGPSYAPYAPASSKRGLSRNSTSSASGTTWRRSTSDATCRPPPNPGYNNRHPPVSTSTTATSALRRPSAPGIRPAVREEHPVATKPGTSVRNTNGTSLRDAILLAGDEVEDYVATTMDSWRLAASSMLFQPAKVGASPTQPAPGTAAAAAAAVPLQSQPAEPDRAAQDTDIANESLACRSSHIPIHHSSDARPSVDQNHAIGQLAMGSALAGVGPVVVEGRQVQTTFESGVGRSSSYAGAQPELESSFRTGLGQQEVRPVLPQIEAGFDVHLDASVHDPSGVHNPSHSPIFMPAASSAECVEAKRLLDLATKLANGVKTTAPTTETNQPLPSNNGCTVGKAYTFGDASTPQLLHSVEHNSSDAAVAAQLLQGQQAPAMTSSGSFSDALALLLQARSCKTGTPVSPTAALRSGLSMSTLGLSTTTAGAPSNEVSQETVCEAHVQPNGLQETGANDTTLLKQPELEDRQRSVNAGVAWRFGDRLIRPQLLQELAGGKDVLVEEQAALASLVYSSPCAVCIIDVRKQHHPIVHANLLFERQTGYTAEEVLGQNYRFLQVKPGGKHRPSVTSIAIQCAIEAGRCYCGKIVNYHKDGTPLWNQLSLVPVRCTKSLQVTHYIGMQSFTKAEPLVATGAAQPAELLRGSSHECLMSLHCELGNSMPKMGKKSSSHMQLSELNPDLASTASLPVCGALNIVRSHYVSKNVANKAPSSLFELLRSANQCNDRAVAIA